MGGRGVIMNMTEMTIGWWGGGYYDLDDDSLLFPQTVTVHQVPLKCLDKR